MTKMNRIRWCIVCILMVGWIYGTRLILNGWDPSDLIEMPVLGKYREIKCAMKFLYNPFYTHWLNDTLRVGVAIFWVGRDKVWVSFWARDGKGLGTDLASFTSSVESSFGEVGTNVVAWGVGYMDWASLRHSFFSPGFMPRKKDPPPSALSPRLSNKGASKSTYHADEEDLEPIVGLGETQEGLATSPQPPPLPPSTVVCDTNKEISGIPSVLVSSNASEQALGSFRSEGTEKISTVAGKLDLAGKPSLAGSMAGLSESDGSPVVQSLYTDGGNSSCSMNESGGVGYVVAGSTPPVTPLFSPEFKAMLGREYLRKTVFSPRPTLSGEAMGGRGLWDGLAQRRSESIGESVSLSVVHVPLPDVHVHVPEEGDEHGSAVHSAHAKVGTTLSLGIALDEGVQASTELGNGVHVSTEMGNLLHGVALGLNPSEEGATDDGLTSHTPVGDATMMDTEMIGLKHPSSPANIQVTENDYGMFSPLKDSNDIQSIIWDSNNGHYNLSGRIQGIDSVTKECDLNTQSDPHQMANSVWNSTVSGLESFAEKIKKSNEIIGLKLEYFPPRCPLMVAVEYT
ncbi:hypothetical protein L1987_58660 [Smallanthus sonchifolius]|uniref:Uncharacterized protein n=1 Tax=Smallanthus sonchifolius TaxID=185202 RepID=A0ACB9DGB3_9ASTR|nr:hypothetical protein L1987_58660 [Smallanthus sonchifolius]